MENIKKNPKERTFEELFFDLRTEKQWKYIDVASKLCDLGVTVDDKTVKKWELGIAYPDLDMIYKLSELFFVSSQDFLNAKEISLKKSYNSIHMTIIKWFCYFTGFTLIYGRFLFYLIIAAFLIGSLMFLANPSGFASWFLNITNYKK